MPGDAKPRHAARWPIWCSITVIWSRTRLAHTPPSPSSCVSASVWPSTSPDSLTATALMFVPPRSMPTAYSISSLERVDVLEGVSHAVGRTVPDAAAKGRQVEHLLVVWVRDGPVAPLEVIAAQPP